VAAYEAEIALVADPENDPVIPWVTIREPVMLVDCN
jgi:hypothetical protein